MALDLVMSDDEYSDAKKVLLAEASSIQTQFELAIQFLRMQVCSVGDGGANAFSGKAAQNMLHFAEQIRNIVADRLENLGTSLGNELEQYVDAIDTADRSLN